MKNKYINISSVEKVLSTISPWISMPECLLDVCDINHSGVQDYTPEYIQKSEYIQKNIT